MSSPDEERDDLRGRLDFIGMNPAALSALAKLRPFMTKSIGGALDAFYRKVKATPHPRKFFVDDQHMLGAKKLQESHWNLIAAAKYDDHYVKGAREIGRTHARIGLTPRWFIGGYALLVEQLIHALVKDQWPSLMSLAKGRPEGVAEALSCLVKAALLDIDYAITAYLEALDDKRQRAEQAAEIIRQEGMAAVSALGAGLERLAAKDFKSRISSDLPESYRKLQTDFNAAIAQLEEALRSVRDSADTIASGSAEISTASDDLSRRTEQQASNLEQTSAALREITATVQKTAAGAKRAGEVVAEARTDADASGEIVGKAVEAMGKIEKSSQEIGQIIGVIDEIAFQTNLLALNAGVEAARAGEAGRGFAVVASEVRALAQRSADAAKQIKSLISASATQVGEGVDLVAETGKALERISVKVFDINAIIAEISTRAQEQATALNQVNSAVNNMDQMTQQNAAMAEQATAASRSMTEETNQLSGLVGQFQIGRAKDSGAAGHRSRDISPRASRASAA